MKVTLKTVERQDKLVKPDGFLSRFKKDEYQTVYVVQLFIELSNEERVVVQKANLLDIGIFTDEYYDPLYEAMTPFQVTLGKMLAQPYAYMFKLPALARQFEETLKSEHLPKIKHLLTQNAKPTTGSETFEL
jgi:hypothetical protein